MLHVVAWPLLSEADDTALRDALAAIDRRPFWFLIDRIARHDLYLYAEPAEGAAELTELHDALNPTPSDEPFQPHITLGVFSRAAEAEQVARIVERQHLPIHGRVEELALLKRERSVLDTLLTVRLGA